MTCSKKENDEPMKDMYSRFTNITNGLKSLENSNPNVDL